MRRSNAALWAAVVAAAACAPQDAPEVMDEPASTGEPTGEVVLGPVDGTDLPPTDLERVKVGDVAPDFSLVSLSGPPVTLSSYRGERNVVLVFYRGHW